MSLIPVTAVPKAPRRRRSGGALGALLLALLLALPWAARAQATEPPPAELVLFSQPACPWCARWDDEIGGSYALTEEGRQAPLRRVDMTATRPPDLAAIEGIRFSPTFVLLRHGREVGRIVGYPGEDFFWPQLDDLLARPETAAGKPPEPATKQ